MPQVFSGEAVHAESCTTDAASVRCGDVYFAIDSLDPGGPARAALAVERGAQAVVTDNFLPIFGTPQFVAPDARQAYGEFCHHLVGKPSEQLTLAGIAGAHGKTTVARLLTGILRAAGKATGCLSDSLQSDGVQSNREDRPKLSAARVARWLGECVAEGCGHAVMEIAPHGVIQNNYAGAKLGLVCLTNLNFDRSSGRAPEADRLLATRLVEKLAPFAVLVANADDPHCMKVLAERTGLTVTYGLNKPADVAGTVLTRDSGGQVLMVTSGCETVAVSLPHLGDALAQDCLAAIASAVAMGLDLATAAEGAQHAIRLPGVMQSVPCGQSFPVYMDQGATPERLRGALNAVRSIGGPGRVIVVLPENPAKSLLSVATALAGLTIAPCEQETTCEDQTVRFVEDRFSALALALALAEAGDVVLMAGAPKTSSGRNSEEAIARQLLELRLSNTPETFVMQ